VWGWIVCQRVFLKKCWMRCLFCFDGIDICLGSSITDRKESICVHTGGPVHIYVILSLSTIRVNRNTMVMGPQQEEDRVGRIVMQVHQDWSDVHYMLRCDPQVVWQVYVCTIHLDWLVFEVVADTKITMMWFFVDERNEEKLDNYRSKDILCCSLQAKQDKSHSCRWLHTLCDPR